MSESQRIDVYMAQNGLAESRSKAQAMISSGFVILNGKRVLRPSTAVSEGDEITVTEQLRFVSRGGEKLLGAINAFELDVKDKVCADIGASTGGFTDCLLKHGAKRVYAIDCGSDQLHPSLRKDPRVISLEHMNARALTRELLGEVCELAVMDVSFISQTLLYPAVVSVLKDGGELVSLIKPQFEVTSSALGGGGILRNKTEHLHVLSRILKTAEAHGLYTVGLTASPITGGDGNREYLAHFILCTDSKPKQALSPDKELLSSVIG